MVIINYTLSLEILLLFYILISSLALCFCQAQEPLDKRSLDGQIFRVGAFEQLPFMISIKSGKNVSYKGASVDVVNMIAEYYNMKVEYVLMDHSEFKKFGGGIGSTNQLKRNEVDFVCFPIVQILEYYYLMDFTFPVWVENYILMQKFPEEESRLTAPIRPFTSTVWQWFFFSCLVFIGVMSFIKSKNLFSPSGIFNFFIPSWDDVYQNTEYTLAIATGNGYYVPYSTKLSTRIALTAWLLSMVVVVNAYSGLLIAYLTVPLLKPTMDTFEDVVNSNELKITVELNSDLYFKFLSASSGAFKQIGDDLRNDPKLCITDPFQVMTNVMGYNGVYPAPTSQVNFYIASDLKSAGKCRLTAGKEPLQYYVSFGFGFAKNGKFTEIVNQKLFHLFWQMGYFLYIRTTYFPVQNQCRADAKRGGRTSPIKLLDFIGTFLLLGIGIGVSFIIFIIELILGMKTRKNRVIVLKKP